MPYTAQDDDQLSEIYGRFFDEDGHARSEEPIPIAKLVQLFRSSDPRVRSKVARMVGRYSQYQAFAARRLQEDDPRVRANAIESLWGVDTQVARRYLEIAVSDPHHRARINAIYGLYLLGDPASIRLLIKETKNVLASFRAAALWAMGQAADPRFITVVREMAGDPDPAVQRVAALSAARIEERVRAERQKRSFQARIVRARGPDPEWRSLTVLVPREIGGSLKPTDFIIEENGNPVFALEVEHATARLPLRLGIAIPEAKSNSAWVADAEAALRRGLAATPPRSAFCIMRYSAADCKPAYSQQGLRAAYATRPELVAQQLGVQVAVGEMQEALNELAAGVSGPEADRELLLFVETDPAGTDAARYCPTPEFIAGVRAKNVPLNIISVADSPDGALQAACASMGGIFIAAPEKDALGEACSTVFDSFLDRFDIRYLSEKNAGPESAVRVTIYCAGGWAEDSRALLCSGTGGLAPPHSRAIPSVFPFYSEWQIRRGRFLS